MRGLEQAGADRSGRRAELFWLSTKKEEVQAALALLAYRTKHHRNDIEPAWQHNDEEVEDAAMAEWSGRPGDNGSLANLYRDYVEKHPREFINPGDEWALEELLAKLTA